MSMLAVNLIKILVTLTLFGFLGYLARAMIGQVAAPPADPPGKPVRTIRLHAPATTDPAPVADGFELEVVTGDGPLRRISLLGRMVIGRTTAADICLDDDLLSATHMALEVAEGAVWVEDLGSRNGTVIDGKRVTGRIRVRPGSTLAAGRTRVTLR